MPDKKKILIVDDEVDFVVILKERLEFEGFEVREAFEGATGLEHMRREAFDVVLLDIMMPKMDGFEVLRTIQREGGTLAQTPIIVVTAYGREFLDEECKALGPVQFIRKPFHPETFLKMIQEVLAGKSGSVHG